MPRAAKGEKTATTKKKEAWIRKQLQKDSTLTRNKISDMVKVRFGSMISFQRITEIFNELRIRYIARGNGKPTRAAARKKSTGGQRTKARARKQRQGGSHRSVSTDDFVVAQDGVGTAEFSDEDRANAHIQALIEEGTSTSDIRKFKRVPISVAIS